jgi:hypothetical protein
VDLPLTLLTKIDIRTSFFDIPTAELPLGDKCYEVNYFLSCLREALSLRNFKRKLNSDTPIARIILPTTKTTPITANIKIIDFISGMTKAFPAMGAANR